MWRTTKQLFFRPNARGTALIWVNNRPFENIPSYILNWGQYTDELTFTFLTAQLHVALS